MASKSKSKGSAAKSTNLNLKTFDFDEIKVMTTNFSEECGSGSFAKVFKGQYNGYQVAVKTYPSSERISALAELDAFKHFGSSPNIVRLLGTCFVHDYYYFVMRFIPKRLDRLLNDVTSLDWASSLNILKQLANAIWWIAKNGFVIGDIKPDNILVDEELNVFLCDFGSAKKTGQCLTTFNDMYSAKEISKKGVGSEKTDVFSLGVILLQMVMKLNDFGKLDYGISEKDKETALMQSKKKKNKSLNPHIAIVAKVEMKTKDHCVHKTLLPGCSREDAMKITKLGIGCASEPENQRPTIDQVKAVLDQIN